MKNFINTTNKNDLILWTDVETSSTDLEDGELLELGIVVSDIKGQKTGEEYCTLFKTNLVETMKKTDNFVLDMHEKSGLWKDLWLLDGNDFNDVDNYLENWSKKLISECDGRKLYFGGNSITLDRNFLQLFLPKFYKQLSFRSIDVTSISLAVQGNSSINGYEKRNCHRALEDAKDSLNEYNHYLSKLQLLSNS